MGGVEARLHKNTAAVAEPNLNGPAGCRRLRRLYNLHGHELFPPAWLSRFFQAKKCGAHRPRSRQKAATLSPLFFCSATNRRHFAHASRPRFCMPHCAAISPSTQDGVGVALTNGVNAAEGLPTCPDSNLAQTGARRQPRAAGQIPPDLAGGDVSAQRCSTVSGGKDLSDSQGIRIMSPKSPEKPHVRIRNECCGCGAGQTAHT